MTIEEEGPPPHPRLQGVLEYLTILAVAIAGMAHAPPWIAVPLAAVVLLWGSRAFGASPQLGACTG
jgi:hypothetical protein